MAAYIDGSKAANGVTGASGAAKLSVTLPRVAGKHSVKLISGNRSTSKTITLGKAVTAKLVKPRTVKARTTQNITGSFGYAAGKVTITVTDPKGKKTTRVVTLNSTGKVSYKYRTGKKGSYKATISYRANAKYYGAKAYRLAFRAK